MPNNILWKYDTYATLTMAVASLASDTNLLNGIRSSVINNETTGYEDIILGGFATTGTSPTAARSIEVWAVAWNNTSWPDVFDGTTGSTLISSAEMKAIICKPVAIIGTNATSNTKYQYSGVSAKNVFGGVLPSRFQLFLVHNTGVALNATAGNHAFYTMGIYPQVQ